ncbi:MAG TPA: YbaK/EbsC family protein [Anaerolineae bacterium]|nr:YbaK/EbsC family protein [Anaerolineae bacterium]
MIDLPPVARALNELRIPYRLFVHAGPVHSLEQAAHERNQWPDQVIRSIVFRVGKDEFLMALMAGDRQIAWPILRRYLGQSRLTLATEDEVRSVTGYERGAVAPFGLPQPMRILVDPSVFTHEEVSLGSGVRGTAVIMTSSDLRQALGNVEVVDLSS